MCADSIRMRAACACIKYTVLHRGPRECRNEKAYFKTAAGVRTRTYAYKIPKRILRLSALGSTDAIYEL